MSGGGCFEGEDRCVECGFGVWRIWSDDERRGMVRVWAYCLLLLVVGTVFGDLKI